MSTIDHGKWLLYTPDPAAIPAGFPKNAIHARREGDLIDWYTYIRPGYSRFGQSTVKGAAAWAEDRQCYIVGPATKDETEIFPAGQYVFEITGYAGTDPFKDYSGKVYHPEDGTFEDYVLPPPAMRSSPLTELQAKYDDLLVRVAKMEKSGGG